MKGATQYDDAAKDAWRGWKWNTIAAALMNWRELGPAERARQLSTKTVLYLVGPDDHDRKRALARGFANHNLIAVDIVQDRIDEVRAAGGFGIRGSLQQLIMNWPSDWQIDVIDADFCSGLVCDVMNFPWCLNISQAIHPDTVVSINMMRGRDSQSNDIRRFYKEISSKLPKGFASRFGVDIESATKHRGFNWTIRLIQYFRRMLKNEFSVSHIASILAGEWNPHSNTYRSKTSGQVFDSVVHRWAMNEESMNHSKLIPFVSEKLSTKTANSKGVRQRIAALRAVRTMKLRELQAS